MDKEKFMYLLEFMDYYICDLVNYVLSDSKTDPHYSAVTATNLIKCYIQVLNDSGENPPYQNVAEYMRYDNHTEEEIAAFEESRVNESTYYTQKQF